MSLSQRVGHGLADINASGLAAFCFAAFSSNALDDELWNVRKRHHCGEKIHYRHFVAIIYHTASACFWLSLLPAS